MSKKLNIIEAMKMPIGTIFEVQYTEGSIDSSKITLNLLNGVKLFEWSSGNIVNANEIMLLESRFIPIQQPVSFVEAITSKKRVKVECDGYASIDDKYYHVGEIFEIIISANKKYGNEIIDKAVKNFITKGEWYIEESEDIEKCN